MDQGQAVAWSEGPVRRAQSRARMDPNQLVKMELVGPPCSMGCRTAEEAQGVNIKRAAEDSLRKLLTSQSLAALATHNDEGPYCSLVAFVASDDLQHLLFATSRNTRKYERLAAEGRVALLIDSRENRETDFHEATAVTVVGTVAEVSPGEREEAVQLYLARHPYLQEFVNSPTCALLKVDVRTYYLVERFQHVVEIHVTP